MPKGCCEGASCSCKIETTGRLDVTGSGSANDPFVLSLEAEITGKVNQTFDTSVTGSGSEVDPWVVETEFAPTARLDDFPDVNAQGPTNGQVLAWNTTTSHWEPAAPTTAATGAVQHDGTLVGDGSAAIPLGVVPITSRLLGGYTNGVGLSDAGMAAVVQHFANATDRTTVLPSPVLNQLSMLDTGPGTIEYWNGTAWVPLPGQTLFSVSGQLLSMSGSYAGSQVTVMTRQINATTDANGQFDALSVADLTGRSGVLTCTLQETGTGTAWKGMVFPSVNRIVGIAYRLTDGSLLSGVPVTGTVQALVY